MSIQEAYQILNVNKSDPIERINKVTCRRMGRISSDEDIMGKTSLYGVVCLIRISNTYLNQMTRQTVVLFIYSLRFIVPKSVLIWNS
jgi:hypothetical protein